MSKTNHRTKENAAQAGDAVALLKRDHKMIKKLFFDYQRFCDFDSDSEYKQGLAVQICSELTVHATIEEEIFYPALREEMGGHNLLNEAEVEHASAKELIFQLEEMRPDEALFDAKVAVLGEYINHHVEEEESEMFQEARKLKLDLVALGAQIMRRRDELRAELGLDDTGDDDENQAGSGDDEFGEDETKALPKGHRRSAS